MTRIQRWLGALPVTTDPHRFRVGVAVLLALVSLLSAFVTFVAAEQGSETSGLNGVAAQQSAEEQLVEQQIDAWVSQDLRLTARFEEQSQTYLQALAQAGELRETDPVRAADYDLDAQAAWDKLRQLYPFFRYSQFLKFDESGVDYDAEGARATARSLNPRLLRPSSDVTSSEAVTAEGKATSMRLVALVLVAALFSLTIAHLMGLKRGLVPAVIGVVVSLTGLIWLLTLDARSGWIALAGLAFALVVIWVVGRRSAARLKGLETTDAVLAAGGPPTGPSSSASADPDSAPDSRFERFVVVAIATAALLGAWVAQVHGQVSSAAEEQDWRARDLGVQSIGALRGAEEAMTVAVETYALGISQKVEAWNVGQERRLARSAGDESRAALLGAAVVQWEALANASYERSGVADQLGTTGVTSSLALDRLRAEVLGPSSRLAALQDAANTAALRWGDRAGVHVSILAWLGVAAYLLGLSMVFKDMPVRRILVSVGILLIVVGGVRSLSLALSPVELDEALVEAAADSYAEGVVASARIEWDEAEAAFTRAIESRPDFALARRDRAYAILAGGSAQTAGVQSVFTDEAVGRALEDLAQARDGGLDASVVAMNMGATLFHRAVMTGSEADMLASAAATRAGLDLAGDEASEIPHFSRVIGESNLGLALIGSGQFAEAAQVYREMSEHILELPPYLQPHLVAASLTTIGILGDADLGIDQSELDRARELIISEIYGAAGASPARVVEVTAEAFPSVVQFRATIEGFDPDRDTLVAEWYSYEPDVDRWHVLPVTSGRLELGLTTLAGRFHPDVGANAYWGDSPNLLYDYPAKCAVPGRYRLEIYLNGALAGTDEVTRTGEEFDAVLARDVGVAGCVPSDWEEVHADDGESIGWAEPGGNRGVTVFRLHQPLSAGGDSRQAALDRLVDELRGGLPPGIDRGQPLDPSAETPFLGRNDGIWRHHSYSEGVAKTVAIYDMSGSGIVIAAVVYGPGSWVDSQEARELVGALIEY